jgi:hypothetical protein
MFKVILERTMICFAVSHSNFVSIYSYKLVEDDDDVDFDFGFFDDRIPQAIRL